jgi:hypothetical protein
MGYRKNRALFAGRTYQQERRASARRGNCGRAAGATASPRFEHPTGGLRPPLLVQCERLSARCTNAHSQERRVVSCNAVAVSVHRPPTGRLCATIAVLPLQTRFSNHGWLTPAAPGCPRADCCRKAVAICNGVLYPTGGLRPPLLVQCERLSAKKRFVRCTNAHSQERRASARRGG